VRGGSTVRWVVVVLAVVAALVAGCSDDALPDELTFTDARIGEPAGPNAALYFTVENPGPATTIVAVETDAGRQTALHEHVMVGGKLVMKQIEGGIDVPVGRTVLEPGGMHIMLIDSADLVAGDQVPVTVVMGDGSRHDFVADVVPLDELVDG
jgi:periplasmic copper chaperone A